jgi:hypothetical protein
MLTFPLVSASLQKVTALWVVDGHVALSVEVTGPGIANADQERIFERFVRTADGRWAHDEPILIAEDEPRRPRSAPAADLVENLAADTADDPFAVRVHPGNLGRSRRSPSLSMNLCAAFSCSSVGLPSFVDGRLPGAVFHAK